MIKFFRQIRKSLLSEGKTRKYLKYAVGEIILVVIGILLAVQINSWYTSLKTSKLKATYTRNLIRDLTKDTIQLNARIRVNQNRFLKRIDSIIAIIENPQTTANDIKKLGRDVPVTGLRTLNVYNDNTFKILISTGHIDLFEDDVMQKIMELNRFQNMVTGVASGNRGSYFNVYTSYLKQYANRFGDNQTLKDELWQNVEAVKFTPIYINMIGTQRHSVVRYISLTKETVLKTEELLEILNKEKVK